MLGYSTNSKGYKIWDLESKCIIISRDVTFDELSIQSEPVNVEISKPAEYNVPVQGGDLDEEI